jgi:hypothetical protein
MLNALGLDFDELATAGIPRVLEWVNPKDPEVGADHHGNGQKRTFPNSFGPFN